MEAKQVAAGSLESLVVGKRIVKADSSLKLFCVAFEDGSGLRIDALMDEGQPMISTSVEPADQLPIAGEAICSVNWSWIYQSVIKSVKSNDSTIKLHLEPAGPLTVGASFWQGSPFLSFQPFKPPAR